MLYQVKGNDMNWLRKYSPFAALTRVLARYPDYQQRTFLMGLGLCVLGIMTAANPGHGPTTILSDPGDTVAAFRASFSVGLWLFIFGWIVVTGSRWNMAPFCLLWFLVYFGLEVVRMLQIAPVASVNDFWTLAPSIAVLGCTAVAILSCFQGRKWRK